MRKFTALLLAALVLVGTNTALANKTLTLDKDTKLVPQGWTVAEDIKFKKNTTVTLNDSEQVIEGVLASATYLRPTGWKSLASNYYYVESSAAFYPPRFFYHPFRPGLVIPADGHVRYMGNRPITFAEDGTVLSGTIDNDVVLQLSDTGYGFVRFKNDTVLTFSKEGKLVSGTLAEATKLRPVGWQHNLQDESAGFVEFKSGTSISFDVNGLVTNGSPNKKTLWFNADGSSTELEAKTATSFKLDGTEQTKAK